MLRKQNYSIWPLKITLKTSIYFFKKKKKSRKKWYIDIGPNNGLYLISSPYENDPRMQQSLKAQIHFVLQQKHQKTTSFFNIRNPNNPNGTIKIFSLNTRR